MGHHPSYPKPKLSLDCRKEKTEKGCATALAYKGSSAEAKKVPVIKSGHPTWMAWGSKGVQSGSNFPSCCSSSAPFAQLMLGGTEKDMGPWVGYQGVVKGFKVRLHFGLFERPHKFEDARSLLELADQTHTHTHTYTHTHTHARTHARRQSPGACLLWPRLCFLACLQSPATCHLTSLRTVGGWQPSPFGAMPVALRCRGCPAMPSTHWCHCRSVLPLVLWYHAWNMRVRQCLQERLGVECLGVKCLGVKCLLV
eukprot:1161601-Pelagomonas_calceolata.AAC.6